MINRLLLIFTLLYSFTVFGQDEKNILLLYKNVIVKSDSLVSIGKISEMDSKSLLKLTKELDNEHPSKYFEHSMKFFEISKYNESAFLYYLGKMRMVDFNKNGNGYYEIGGDDNVLLQEGNFMFLAVDIDNFSRILKLVIDYYNNNDYSYISKNKGYQKVKNPSDYLEMINAFQKDKEKIKKELSSTREEMKNRVMEYFDYYPPSK